MNNGKLKLDLLDIEAVAHNKHTHTQIVRSATAKHECRARDIGRAGVRRQRASDILETLPKHLFHQIVKLENRVRKKKLVKCKHITSCHSVSETERDEKTTREIWHETDEKKQSRFYCWMFVYACVVPVYAQCVWLHFPGNQFIILLHGNEWRGKKALNEIN